MSESRSLFATLLYLLSRLGIDRAVAYAVLARGWQFVSGPVTLTLLSLWLTDAERGYFYTFSSLLALQVFFELSLHVVIITLASHEWAHLRIDDDGSLTGDPASLSRLVSLGRACLFWYAIAGAVFFVGISGSGAWFLGQESLPWTEWLSPWLCLTACTSLLLGALPLTSLLEGCDQMRVVNRYRVLQAVTGSIAVWLAIVLDGGLWASVAAAAVRLFWEIHLLAVRYRPFFRSMLSAPRIEALDWRMDVWPLQWRVALQGIVIYLAMHLLTPVIFHYHGDIQAGRVGMTWTVLASLDAAAFAWVDTRRSRFGQHIARREFRDLDRLFLRQAGMSVLLLATASAAFCGCVWLLQWIEHPIASRLARSLLTVEDAWPLALGVTLFQLPRCVMIYMRAHGREPFLAASLASNLLIGGAIWWCGSRYSVAAAGLAYSGVVLCVHLPLWGMIWLHIRREWHTGHGER